MLHDATVGKFKVDGLRRDFGFPHDMYGELGWMAKPAGDGECLVTACLDVLDDDADEISDRRRRIEGFSPKGNPAVVKTGTDLLRRLAGDCADARDELLDLLDSKGRGYDLRASDAPPMEVFGRFFFVLKNWPNRRGPERQAGMLDWWSNRIDGGVPSARRIRVRSGFDLLSRSKVAVGLDVDDFDADYVGRLGAGDWSARREFTAHYNRLAAEEGAEGRIYAPSV